MAEASKQAIAYLSTSTKGCQIARPESHTPRPQDYQDEPAPPLQPHTQAQPNNPCHSRGLISSSPCGEATEQGQTTDIARREQSADGDGDGQGGWEVRAGVYIAAGVCCIYGGAFPRAVPRSGVSGDFLPKLWVWRRKHEAFGVEALIAIL